MKCTYYTNDVNEKRCKDLSDVPEGWYKGRVKSPVTTLGKKHYNNGVVGGMFIPGTEPDGYILGRLPLPSSVSEKANKTKRECAYKWYNNGSTQMLLKSSESVPKGYELGRLPLTEQWKMKLSKSHIGLKRSPETQNKINNTLKLNRKSNEFDSEHEKKIYNYLVSKYGEHDVIYHYTDERYSFNGMMYECDFYIKSKDLFIEYNGFPNHYTEPFDKNNEQHIKLLEQCKNNPKNFIDCQLVTVWAGTDVEKLHCAKKNNLNYKIYYKLNEIISE